MNIVLSNSNRPGDGVVTIPLPIPRKEYDHSLALLQILGIGNSMDNDCYVIDIHGGIPMLNCLIGKHVNIDEVDYLAKRLESFDQRELAVFQGMLSKFQEIAVKTNGLTKQQSQILTGALDAESINGPDDILSVIDRLDEYAFIPNVTCDKELGGYLVDRGYMDVPSRLRPYLDYPGIGAEYYAEHGGAYTNQGYVLHKDSQGQSLETEKEPLSQQVRKWYEKEYPEDELGNQISDITFSDIVDGLNDGKDIYDTVTAAYIRSPEESRQRIFKHLAELLPESSEKQIMSLMK